MLTSKIIIEPVKVTDTTLDALFILTKPHSQDSSSQIWLGGHAFKEQLLLLGQEVGFENAAFPWSWLAMFSGQFVPITTSAAKSCSTLFAARAQHLLAANSLILISSYGDHKFRASTRHPTAIPSLSSFGFLPLAED